MSFSHETVLLNEAVEALTIKPDGIYLDGTVGGAGHSLRIAKMLSDTGLLISFDKDPEAVAVATERLKGLPARVIRADFKDSLRVLSDIGVPAVDGILLDLGVSSHQIDTAGRGFSYNADAPLDMRMSSEGLSAYDIVNTWSEAEISKVLFRYSEEKFSRRIADLIVKRRESAPINSTLELAELVKAAIPAPARRTGGNPAKRTFQALRIAVNSELDGLSEFLSNALSLLTPGGRIAVITFHSLEDRIVKQRFNEWCKGCVCPPDCPVCICNRKPKARLINKKPLLPSEEELERNSRSHSAKLRVAEKL